ncbi:endonuclease/Exonuclease/phosphatase [Diaporthe sp. PMI_573]|nr:endonuclease/Exonuclease/phosphatase [Diaporthaceae sp. PMI_573]
MLGLTATTVLALWAGSALAQTPIRVASFNIRYDNTDISIADTELYWSGLTCASDPYQCRVFGVLSELVNVTSAGDSFVGMQEVLDNQLNDIMDAMKQTGAWEHIGVARDDGKSDGEYNPIIYKTDVFELVHEETKWLSETPDTPSKSWDSGSNRIVTVGVFKHIATGRLMIMANTHLDNAVAEARTNQIGVAVDIIKAVDAAYGPNLPTFLTGDFNSGDSDPAYTTLVAENYLQDLYAKASPEQRSQRFYTYTGFAGEYSSRIDYIWFGPQSGPAGGPITIKQYAVEDNVWGTGRMSDHRCVVGDVTLG